MNNKTLSTSALAGFVVATTLLTGCTSLPKTDLASDNREKLHSIAMLDVAEPRGENVANFGGAAGAFGLIGGLVQGGVNSSHTSTYTQHVASEKIAFAPVVNDGLTTRLSSDGYEIVVLHDQHAKLSSDGKSDDFSDVKTTADAILSVWITSLGYASPPASSDFIPWVVIRARLLDSKSKQDMYFKTFACGWDIKGNSVHVVADAKYHYGSFGTLIEQFDQSVAGLKDCEQAVVAAIGQDLTKQQ
ncbi:hypothetical protein [Paraburkholderia sp. BCC1885]|uniref:hypothetical protein n=1 Tax=Paraburkholderia sp. BCC1885 TaxID=2562669 RepID=UPI0021B18694|nr:hypothetical protein [Paraburkholderia sp. BCC1885]